MPPLTRRNWSTMLTELQLRTGNITATGFTDRLKHLLVATYQDICTTYHHLELDKIDTSIVCSTSNNEITLPTDLYSLVGIRLKAVGGASILGPILIEDFRLTSHLYALSSGRPSRGGVFGRKFYFDTKPDQAYPLEVFYYRTGTVPDFDTPTTSDLAIDVDEHIIEGAIRKAFPALARPDLGEVHRQLLDEWLASQVRMPTIDGLVEEPERERTSTTYPRGQG